MLTLAAKAGVPRVATAFSIEVHTDATVVGPAGYVKPEFVLAALDCPGGWAVAEFHHEPKILLGQLAVHRTLLDER